MTPFCSAVLVANYLTTCIGWSGLLGLDVEHPSFTGGGYLGIFPFFAVWVIMGLPAQWNGDQRRAKRRPWPTFVQESGFDAEALGWATTL